MKGVLISIQSYWVFLIIAKKMGWKIDKNKTVEIRKSFPKDKAWNRQVEIYCSKDKKSFDLIPKEYQPLMKQLLGRVVGSFTCDKIEEVYQCNSGWVQEYACICRDHFFDYLGIQRGTHFGYDKKAYGWHISDLKIYDKPREIGEFKKENKCYKRGDLDNIGCWERNCLHQELGWCDGRFSKITRPPQSYMFVEEI